MPRSKLRLYKQEEDSSCLPACLRMVLATHGKRIAKKELRELCDWHPRTAVSSTAVVAAARALGFIQTREEYGLRLHDLRDELRRGIYPIVGIDLRVYGLMGQHAQVMAGITSREVLLYDPLLGRLKTNLLTFEEVWSMTEFLAILME